MNLRKTVFLQGVLPIIKEYKCGGGTLTRVNLPLLRDMRDSVDLNLFESIHI